MRGRRPYVAPSMAEPVLTRPLVAEETVFDAAAAEAVVARAFGPGRFAKTAERLREGGAPLAAFVLRDGPRVIGSVRLWPITVGGLRAGFLGPIAVDEVWRGSGAGADLTAAVIERARELGLAGVLLVGDAPYFGRFGFEIAPGVRLPGPVDQRRVLWLSLDGVAAEGEARRG